MIYGGLFDPDQKRERLKALEEQMNQPDFWNDNKKSEAVIAESNSIKKILDEVGFLQEKLKTNLELLKELKTDEDQELKELIETELTELTEKKEILEVQVLLNEPYDKEEALIEIHPGAGGTESCDWASMLYRMYTRWMEQHDFRYEILDLQAGDEAGIKSVTIHVFGINAYGYLKCEKGVHRLVRISPFDSGARRHTSFASVAVTPYFKENEIKIELDEKDLKIDVYRSSGNGGQGVNTTDSAVRITHLPTKIVVTCQNERSQIQNKARCMEMLKSKLFQLELERQEQELKKLKGESSENAFGSQIRSYVLHPYMMVKDHRTKEEVSDAKKVLDGDIDNFIYAFLKRGR